MDMSEFTVAKSDQMNADDLISGPRTVTITSVKGSGNPEQPVAVHFDGDNGKPFMPCKTMRRVMIAAWGKNAAEYIGRSLTLYRDPKVKFGGMEVGGIRISHMSHLDGKLAVALMATKGKRAVHTVLPLQQRPAPAQPAATDDRGIPDLDVPDEPPAPRDVLMEGTTKLLARINAAETVDALHAIAGDNRVGQWRTEKLAPKRPELEQRVALAFQTRFGALQEAETGVASELPDPMESLNRVADELHGAG